MANFTTLIDNRDPRIRYKGAWKLDTSEFNDLYSTRHGTNVTGSQANFSFNGSSIMVYGGVEVETHENDPTFASISSYSVDGAPPVFFISRDGGEQSRSHLLYKSHNLSCGSEDEHTLDITSMLELRATLWIDYFQVIGCKETLEDTATLIDVPSKPHSTATGLPESSSIGRGGPLLKGILAEVAIGCSVVIVFAILAFYIVRRRRKSKGLGESCRSPTSGSLRRRPALRQFRLGSRLREPTLTPFLEVSDTTHFASEGREFTNTNHRNYDNPYRSRPLPAPPQNLRPCQEGYVTQGGSFAHKYAQVGVPALESQQNTNFMGADYSRPGRRYERVAFGTFAPNHCYQLEDASRIISRTPPPTYRTIPSRAGGSTTN